MPPDSAPLLHGEGVAIVLRGSALCDWKYGGSQWRPISSRLAGAQLRMVSAANTCSTEKTYVCIHVVVCYAPTFRSPRDTKDVFFNDLQCVPRDVPRGDKFILLGDFNARVGSRSNPDDVWSALRVRVDSECAMTQAHS